MQTLETLQNRLSAVIKARFPDSYLHFKVSTLENENRPSLIVSFALGSGPDNWPNHIIHNDPGHTIFLIYSVKNTDGSISDLTLDGSIAGYWTGSKREKLNWRDIKQLSNEDKVVRQVTRYFDSMLAAVLASTGRLA